MPVLKRSNTLIDTTGQQKMVFGPAQPRNQSFDATRRASSSTALSSTSTPPRSLPRSAAVAIRSAPKKYSLLRGMGMIQQAL